MEWNLSAPSSTTTTPSAMTAKADKVPGALRARAASAAQSKSYSPSSQTPATAAVAVAVAKAGSAYGNLGWVVGVSMCLSTTEAYRAILVRRKKTPIDLEMSRPAWSWLRMLPNTRIYRLPDRATEIRREQLLAWLQSVQRIDFDEGSANDEADMRSISRTPVLAKTAKRSPSIRHDTSSHNYRSVRAQKRQVA